MHTDAWKAYKEADVEQGTGVREPTFRTLVVCLVAVGNVDYERTDEGEAAQEPDGVDAVPRGVEVRDSIAEAQRCPIWVTATGWDQRRLAPGHGCRAGDGRRGKDLAKCRAALEEAALAFARMVFRCVKEEAHLQDTACSCVCRHVYSAWEGLVVRWRDV